MTTLWIIVDNGKTFEGTAKQFSKNFFLNENIIDKQTIEIFCQNEKMSVKFKEVIFIEELNSHDREYYAQEAMCLHMCLDDRKVLRKTENGLSFSLWGRVCRYLSDKIIKRETPGLN